jgi:predicted CopG family antitoxin
MTKRMTISIDDDVYEFLERWADTEVRTVANLAAALVTQAAREKQQNVSKASSELKDSKSK